MKNLLLFGLCIALVGCASDDQYRRHAYSRTKLKRSVRSPIGGYVATSDVPNAKSLEREIVITKPGDKRQIIRFPFQRQVDVSWAPDERGVAVIDLVLQNETRVVIFKLPEGQPVFELRREHVCEFNPDLPCGNAYVQVFFSNITWLAPDRIGVNVDMIGPLAENLPPRVQGQLVATFPLTPPESKSPDRR